MIAEFEKKYDERHAHFVYRVDGVTQVSGELHASYTCKCGHQAGTASHMIQHLKFCQPLMHRDVLTHLKNLATIESEYVPSMA